MEAVEMVDAMVATEAPMGAVVREEEEMAQARVAVDGAKGVATEDLAVAAKAYRKETHRTPHTRAALDQCQGSADSSSKLA